MTVRYFYMDPEANPVELTDRVWTALEWNSSAEEANAVASEWVLEDPDSDLDGIYAWRRVYCLDPDAPADHTVIGMGFIADVHIGRSEVYGRNATSRAWRLTITDLNYMLTYPLFDSADSPNRPVETDLARIAWYLTTQEAQHFPANTDFIDTTGGVNLDANDLLNRSPYDLVRGAMDQSGRNCFVLYDESKGGPDFDIATLGELAIWYALPSSDLWQASVALSNDLADIDPDNGVFALGEEDNDYHPDPSRIYWKLHGLYDGGLVTVFDNDIRDEYTGRETIVDCSDLTDPAKATARVNRMLVESSIPNSRIAWGYYCRSDYVNGLLAGQSFQYRATHLGGLDYLGVPDFSQVGGVQMRAMDRSVREVAPGVYYVSGSAVPTGNATPCDSEYAATPSGTYAPPHSASANSDAVVFYFRTGDPTPEFPDPDFEGNPNFPEYGTGGSPDFLGDCAANTVRVLVVGAGTLVVETATHGGGARNLTVTLNHRHLGDGDPTIDETQMGVTGGTFTFEVSTHGGTECVHWVDYTDDGSVCGSKFGFAGATWTSAEA